MKSEKSRKSEKVGNWKKYEIRKSRKLRKSEKVNFGKRTKSEILGNQKK